MVYVTKQLGYAVIAAVLYVIHYIVYYEIFLIRPMLNELGPYENDLNYLFGWPLYFLIMTWYIYSCLAPAGPPPEYLHFYRTDLQKCSKWGARKPGRTWHCTRCQTWVMRRDHHWDFTNSCVGYHNQKAFLIFLCFTPVCCLNLVLRGAQFLYHYRAHDLAAVEVSSLYFGVFLAHYFNWCMFAYFTFRLALYNVINLTQNLTHLQMENGWLRKSIFYDVYSDPVNTFDMGPVANMAQVFDLNPLLWLWPFKDSISTLKAASEQPEWPQITDNELVFLNPDTLPELDYSRHVFEQYKKYQVKEMFNGIKSQFFDPILTRN